MIVVYDGTFEGYLTLVYEVYHSALKIKGIEKKIPQTLFADEVVNIEYNEENSLKVLEALKTKFEKSHFETVLNIFMCEDTGFEMELLQFIILGFKDQKQLNNINHPFVFNILNLQKELFRFNHKMTGFVRFEELNDATLYAKIDTKFNILYFLGRHFLKRLSSQSFIIHDIKRETAFIKNDNFAGIRKVSHWDIPRYSKDEKKFQKLWKTFFQSVSIESRRNEKLQKQFVPLIYRTYMNEFD